MGNKLSHQRESAVSYCVRCLALPWAALSEALKQTSIAPIEHVLCHVLAVITSLRGRASQGDVMFGSAGMSRLPTLFPHSVELEGHVND
jgi:hypothetical protein